MRKFISICGVIYVVMLVIACQAIEKNAATEFTSTSESLITAIINPNPTSKLTTRPLESIFPTLGLSTPSVLTKTSTSTATATATQTENPVIICSPLMDETITSLWEIVTNPFGEPPPGREDLHHGVDFAYYRRGNRLSIEGEVVQSILPGAVAASIQDRLPYGNMVIIETNRSSLPSVIIDRFDLEPGEAVYSLYAHMGQFPQVEIGETVSCGQDLGTVGTTGYDIVNPHLHLETRIGPSGTRFISMAFYDTSATVEEMDNYLRWRTSGDFRPVDPMMVFSEYLSFLNPGFQTPTP